MKKLACLSIALLIALVVAVPVSAGKGGWSKKVTGGMSYASPYGEFTVTLSAQENADGTYRGEGQYFYPAHDRTFHLDVTRVCFGTLGAKSWAAAIGTVRGQDGTEVTDGGYGGIAVLDGGVEADRLRVAFDKSESYVNDWCDNGAEGSFPATVVDGSFHVRSK